MCTVNLRSQLPGVQSQWSFYFVGPESVAELIRSLDGHCGFFLISGSQDVADLEGKQGQHL